MKNCCRQFDMAKMARTLGHAFATSLALEVPVNGAHPRVHKSAQLGFVGCLIHDLGMFDFRHGVCFLKDGRQEDEEMAKHKHKRAQTISSGERIPNCTSATFRTGAVEKANWWPSIVDESTGQALC